MTEPTQNPGKSFQAYATPMDFIYACVQRFGEIRCDLAASDENKKAPAFYGEGADSLTKPWAEHYPNGTLYLNPPFGDIEPWAKKCALESTMRRGLILMLTPASIDTHWFSRHVHRKAMVLAVSPRLTFVGCTASFPKALMVSVFGMGLHGFDVWRWKP